MDVKRIHCDRCGAMIDNEARMKEQQEHPTKYFPRLAVDNYIYVQRPPFSKGALTVDCYQLCDDCQKQLETWFNNKNSFVTEYNKPSEETVV